MSARDITVFDTDALAWLVWEFDHKPEEETRSEAEHPGFPTRVRAEFATRPQVLPRHLRDGRHPR